MNTLKLPWILLLVASTALALPPAPTPEDAAHEVELAHRAQNAAVLRTLASRDDPDPWAVADALCARELFDVAVEFVLAAPRLDTAKLRTAIEAARNTPAAADDRAQLAAALESSDLAPRLEKLQAIETDGKSLFGARVLAARADAAGTAEAYRSAADAARALGWLRLAAMSEGRAAAALEATGNLPDAVAAARARLAVETRRGRTAQLADALIEAGRLSLTVAELPEAEDLLRRALRQSQRAKNAAQQARSRWLLGRTFFARGSLQDARVYLLMAAEEFRALNDEPAMLAALEPVVELDWKIEGVEPALKRVEEALTLARSSKNRAAEGRLLTLSARMERQRKDWVAAVAHFDAAEAAFRDTGGKRGAGEAAYGSGVLSLRMGRRDAARVSLARAEADAKAVADPELQAKVQSALGDLSLELGQIEQAERHFEAAAKQAEAARNPALAARALSRLGRLALRQDKPKEARTRLTQALQQLRQVKDIDDEVRTLLALGEAERRLGNRENAMRLADEVAAIARRDQLPGVLARAAALRGLSALNEDVPPAEAAAAFEPLRFAAREAIALHQRAKLMNTPRFEADLNHLLRVGVDVALAANDASKVLQVCEFRRSRAVLQALGGRDALLLVLTPPALQKLRDDAAKIESAAVAAYERARTRMDKGMMLAARDKVQKVRAEIADIDKRIDARLAHAKSLLAPEATAVDAVQAALGPNESLLYYCAGVETIGVVVLTRGTTRTLVLDTRRELERMTAELQKALRTGAAESILKQVREKLYLPLGIADNLRELVIVPVAPIDRVPFCVVDSQATVRYCGSAASVVQTAAMSAERGIGVLGVGNTTFASSEIRLRLVHLTNGIPIRRLEVGKKLADLFQDVVLVGPPATESQVLDAIGSRARWQAIHFAAPFLLDGQSPYASLLGLAPDDGNDGVLNLHELMRVGLRSEMTLLAACEPSKATLDTGATIRAVARGIQLAGSARLMTSQWWMDDAAASALMAHFYRFWQNRETPAPLALRRAQSKVAGAAGWGPPKYWAGWQIWGAR